MINLLTFLSKNMFKQFVSYGVGRIFYESKSQS